MGYNERMKLIVGLGNPGKEYEHTRHNAGFKVLDELRKLLDFSAFHKKEKLFSEISEGKFGNEKIILAKPQAFMNQSGKAVAALLRFYKIQPVDMWIVYDDIDLIEGTFRIRSKGSAGTHNGMRSVAAMLGHGNFPRFRLGIAKETMSKDIVKFILTPLATKNLACFEEPIHTLTKAIFFALKDGIEAAMNSYN